MKDKKENKIGKSVEKPVWKYGYDPQQRIRQNKNKQLHENLLSRQI